MGEFKSETSSIDRSPVAAALNQAFNEAQVEGAVDFDIHDSKMIIFSDHHKGNRDGADDFRICERAYNAALAYYYQLGYTLVVLGDVEELWEERPQTVLKAYAHTLTLEGKFHRAGRYLRFWGNHDDDWRHPDLVKAWLAPALGTESLKIYESMILHVRDGEQELGKFFLAHGHQGTLESDHIAPLSKLFVRYIWRPIQRILNISINTPAEDFQLRHAHDSAMYAWSEAQDNVVLIAGHTHRPVFKSETHEVVLRKALQKSQDSLTKAPNNPELQKNAADLAAELEWNLAKNQTSTQRLPAIELKKPSYFNTGCCAFSDGDITGLEISAGEIRLVRWPDDENNPQPKVLAKVDLKAVFAAC
jgi:hypothetical protein